MNGPLPSRALTKFARVRASARIDKSGFVLANFTISAVGSVGVGLIITSSSFSHDEKVNTATIPSMASIGIKFLFVFIVFVFSGLFGIVTQGFNFCLFFL